MDEKDARLFGVRVVRRDMAFTAGYVVCTNCECNYDASAPTERTFCQIYSTDIDPAETAANELRAEACDQWVPLGIDRNKIITPEHSYRYDKWG